MDEKELAENLPQAAAAAPQKPAEPPKNAVQMLYDKIRLPIWVFDAIIGAGIAGIVVALILGILNR